MNRSGVYARAAQGRYTESKGKLEESAYRFVTEAALLRWRAYRILGPVINNFDLAV